jgi:hypothetical protein
VTRWSATNADYHRGGVEHVPRVVAEHPTFIRRLHWKFGARVPIADAQVAESIARAPEEAVWFVDNNVFSEDVDPAIVEALLEMPGRMVLTPLVNQELLDWLPRHRDNPMARAIEAGTMKAAEWAPPAPGEPGRTAYEYYLALLGQRRYVLRAAEDRFRREHGRDPEPAELQALQAEIQKQLGARALLIAKKGPGARPTDEALVYLALHHALTTGRPTQILTADGDVEDQFVKLLWLVNTQYRGMLIADHYVGDFSSFRPRPFPDRFLADTGCPFESDSARLIDRGDARLERFLPPDPRCVAVACWRIGAYFNSNTFMAEQEMGRLLDIKDRTGGLSTDRLGGRNVHPYLGCLPLNSEDAMSAAVVFDKRLPLSGTSVAAPRLDILLAQGNFEERVKTVGSQLGPVQMSSPKGTPVMYEDVIVPARAEGRRGGRQPST